MNYKLWPGSQVINFALVPKDLQVSNILLSNSVQIPHQVLFTNFVGLIWNTYLSLAAYGKRRWDEQQNFLEFDNFCRWTVCTRKDMRETINRGTLKIPVRSPRGGRFSCVSQHFCNSEYAQHRVLACLLNDCLLFRGTGTRDRPRHVKHPWWGPGERPEGEHRLCYLATSTRSRCQWTSTVMFFLWAHRWKIAVSRAQRTEQWPQYCQPSYWLMPHRCVFSLVHSLISWKLIIR